MPSRRLERLVSGEVAERDKGRVKIWRWLTDEEALEHGIVHPEPKPPKQPQLPGPSELQRQKNRSRHRQNHRYRPSGR
jgi:hypothetical protein